MRRQREKAIIRRRREKGNQVSPWLGRRERKLKLNEKINKIRETKWEVASGKATWLVISG